jgi:ABC-type bacteriocin/lantibiotic exporter with double-glycine peptidase domain
MAADARRPALRERFPALDRLGAGGRRRRIPVVHQLTATDCAASCLTMVLAYHGKWVPLDEARQAVGASGRDGANARAILQAAHAFGLRGRGVRIGVEKLPLLPPGSILHWEFNHFVVFERLHKGHALLVDPELGRRRVTLDELGRAFTGVALLLEPSTGFVPTPPGRSPTWQLLRRSLTESGDWMRILVVSLLLQLFGLGLPMLTGAVVDRVVPRGDGHLLTVLAIGLGALVLFFFLAMLIRSYLLLHMRTLFDARMTLGFLDHLLELPYAFFQRRSAGDLMMRLNSNSTIRELLTASAISALLDGFLVFIYLVMLFVVSRSFGLLVLLLALLQVGALVVSNRRQRELMAENLRIQARAESHLVEMLAGIETLKVTGAELRKGQQWSSLFVDQLNVVLARGRLDALIESILGAIKLASPLTVLTFGTIQVLHGSLSLGNVLAVCALASGVLLPVAGLVATGAKLQVLRCYIDRIEDVLMAPPEQPRDRVRVAPTLRGAITLERVTFRYNPSTPDVVREVSIAIEPGQMVAIVGHSGSGKSTLASLLLGLYSPSEGRILYDGRDLMQLDVRAVRRQLGIVNQRAYLFGGSVRSNIALAEPEIASADVERAARLAHIHDEIMAMPMGYDSVLLDGGASLSGGQRQRVAIARALVHRPAILLLDEATSALDAVTEQTVQRNLAALSCTRVVIAHRLSTIQKADLILVMREGRLVEQGTHATLLAAAGEYALLVAAQMSG